MPIDIISPDLYERAGFPDEAFRRLSREASVHWHPDAEDRMPGFGPSPGTTTADEARRLRSNFINGIKELPVRFTPSRPCG